jgi:CBS domain containing-hemolysin-like protein
VTVALIGYFSLALLASFLCSLLEAVILSTPRSYADSLVESGRPGGEILRRVMDRLDRSLAAILTLNTLAHTGGAAGVGAETAGIARRMGADEDTWVGIAAAIVTVAILVFSEIIPKSLGARYARPLAPMAARTVAGLVFLMYPAVVVLEMISRSFGSAEARQAVTREEVRALTRISHEGGGIHPREAQVIANLLGLQDVQAQDVMTPRVEVFVLATSRTVSDVLTEHRKLRFARIPVFGENPDKIEGLVLRYRIFEAMVRGKSEITMQELAGPIHFVPETMTIARLLEEFIQRRGHLFAVVNEFGGVEGIVTLEDVVETILGVEIVDELDTVEDLRRLARLRLEERKRRLKMDDDLERDDD